MKTEYFILLAFFLCGIVCLAIHDKENLIASWLISALVGVGIVIDREIINPSKPF